jgi:hypothetical protein
VGSYAPFTIGGYELFQTKSYVDPIAMSVFSEGDRVAVLISAGPEGAPESTPIPASWSRSELYEYRDDDQKGKDRLPDQLGGSGRSP